MKKFLALLKANHDMVTAQFAHVAVAGWVVCINHKLFWPVIGAAATKEFIEAQFDLWEAKDSWGNSAIDFIFFLIGAVVGVHV